MLTLVQRARRRLLHNELFHQGAYAAAAILIAFILLLLAGTGLLDWRWMTLVSVLALAAAMERTRRRRVSLYAAAQVVDRRLDLSDTISTAVYFQQESARPAAPELRQYQLERADQISRTVDVRRAVPYAMPRGVYLLAVLVLVAGSLFALRYGLMGRLDLHAPLAHMLRDQFGWKQPNEVARNTPRPPKAAEQPDDAGAAANDPDLSQTMRPDTAADDSSDANNDSSAEKGDPTKGDSKQEGNRNGKAGSEEQNAQAESNSSQSEGKPGDQAGKQDQKQQSEGKPESKNGGENSSLMNKMKDMFQNMLSSLKPPSGNPGNQQQNNDPNNQKNGQQKQNEKNNQAQNKGQKSDESQGEPGEPSPDQQAENQANAKNDPQTATKQPGSGAGNQDGDKRIKQAEDLSAMGKISEIFGKRSANLTGEATVEVKATSQQLKTAYSAGTAQHGQSGGEINRDEVPVAMQPFVQEYFKQARQQPAPPAPGTTPAAPKK